MFHLAYALYLLSLTAGLAILIWALRAEGKGRGIAKFFGTVIIILSLLGAFCIGFYGIKYWQGGYFSEPMLMHSMM
jgi:hypothetical protein